MVRSLQKEAADEGTTVNARVNSILSRHLDYDKKVGEFGIAGLPRVMLMSLLEGCDDETLARVGRESVPMQKEMAEFFVQDSSPKGILNFLKWRSRFNSKNKIEVTQEEDECTIVMRHDFGPKWSIIDKNYLEEFVKQTFHVEPRISMGESVVTARFKVNPRDFSTTLPSQP
ncbi:MAG: hypothetical protein ABSB29_04400 [Nitrososphaerales archaeon]